MSPCPLRNTLNKSDKFFAAITLVPRHLHELLSLGKDDALLSCATRDRDTPATTKFEDAFLAQHAKCPKHGVGVHFENRRQISSGWKLLTRCCLTVGDRTPDVAGHLVVQ